MSGMEPEKQAEIISLGKRKFYDNGETLFQEGTPANKCFLVLEGRLKLYKLHETGKEAIIRYINPNEMTAAIAVFKGRDYPVTAEAIGRTEVVSWNKSTMLGLIMENAPLAVNLLHAVIGRIDELQARYLELAADQVEYRIARSLLRIMRQSGTKTDEGILINFKLSRQELADYTGTTLYTVSRILSSWEKNGWIKSGRQRILITDPHALVSFSESR